MVICVAKLQVSIYGHLEVIFLLFAVEVVFHLSMENCLYVLRCVGKQVISEGL